MFGRRARIGYISPGALEISAYDFYQIAPEGVGLVGLSAPISDWRPEEYAKNLDAVVEASRYLAHRHVQMIVHAGAPTVASRGASYMHQLVSAMKDATGLPATTAMWSAIEAFRELGSDKLAVITPFPRESHDNIVGLLRDEGLSVEHEENFDADFFTLHEVDEREIFDFVTAAVRRSPGAEIAYLPCPQWHVFEMAAELEEALGIPIVTSDGGDFWWAFKTLGIDGVAPGHGTLLDRLQKGGISNGCPVTSRTGG
jgi:maleate cis-trans isomerase